MKILILGSLSNRDSTIEGTIIRVPYFWKLPDLNVETSSLLRSEQSAS